MHFFDMKNLEEFFIDQNFPFLFFLKYSILLLCLEITLRFGKQTN